MSNGNNGERKLSYMMSVRLIEDEYRKLMEIKDSLKKDTNPFFYEMGKSTSGCIRGCVEMVYNDLLNDGIVKEVK